ncbi:MAG: inner-rane translocator [Solirubrobacterales bacterium]|jgi:ribose transport system permease protein|nr:inner-rane translocator [Solirubrobacterales bacterium]
MSTTTTEPTAAPAAGARRLGTIGREYGIVIFFLILFVGLSLSTSTFLQERNLLNILDQSAPLGIIACAVTICMVCGIFDLSTGAIYGLSAVVACKVANAASPDVGVLAGVLCGLALGLVNAIVIHLTRINSFIGTLATSIVFRGGALLVTGGSIVTVLDEHFTTLGTSDLLGAKYSVWVFGAFFLITAFVLARTTFGRYVYAVGGNEEAARLSGVRTAVIRGACYALSGLAAGIAGVLAASRTASAQADLGVGLELSAIAAAVVGGTSILGGEGAVWRGVLGVLTLAIIGNGFDLLNIDSTYQQLVQGVLILTAVAADQLLRRRQR